MKFVSFEQMSNSIYSNNANVEFGSTPLSLAPQFPSSLPSGAVDNLTSVYDSIVYLGNESLSKFVFPSGIVQLCDCYVQKCELSYNVLGMTQNCISPSEIIIPNRECVIRLGIGEGANVIFKQVSHTIR